MAKHIAKRTVFMGGTLVYSGSPIEKSLIPEEFEKHFEGFDEKKAPAPAPKPVKGKEQSEDEVKLALEKEGKKYGVDLDRRRPVARLEKELAAAKLAFETENA